jgi:peroxiredoxin
MNEALLAARLALSAVFIAAGLAKLTDRAGARQAVVQFGVPEGAAAVVASGLPLFELAVGAALLPTASARGGAIGALVLLVAFSVGIAVNLVRGNTPDCHCFGQLTRGRVSRLSLLRNVVLVGAAALVSSGGGGQSIGSALNGMGTAERLGVIGLVGAVLIVGIEWRLLLRALAGHGHALLGFERIEMAISIAAGVLPSGSRDSLPVGSPAPRFKLDRIDGVSRSLDDLLSRGRSVLLLFTEARCQPCKLLLPEVARWQAEYDDRVSVAVIARGDPVQNRAIAEEHQVADVLLQVDNEVAEAYRVTATPSALFVRTDGTLGSGVGAGAEAIRLTLAAALRRAGDGPRQSPAIEIVNVRPQEA